jgi:transcriptional regulator with XRE-family HTH domain
MEEKKSNKNLRRERELRGWSQRILAELVDTTEQVVNRWESGHHKPNRHFQTQLCQLFGKSAEELGFMSEPQITKEEEGSRTDREKENVLEQPSPSPLKQSNELQELLPLLSQAVSQGVITAANELENRDLDKLL